MSNENDCWVIVGMLGVPRARIGRVTMANGKQVSKEESWWKEAILSGSHLVLMPSFDYFLLERIQPEGGSISFGRDPLISPNGIDSSPCPVHVHIGPGVVVELVSEKSADDQATLRKIIDHTTSVLTTMRVKKSGIVLPDGST